MLFGSRCLPDTVNSMTDEQCIQALQTRLGRPFDLWNCETGDSLNSTINVAATWPNQFQLDCQTAGKLLYLQIHFNQSPGSGTASDLEWPDLLNPSRPMHSAAVSQTTAYLQRIKLLGGTAAYLCGHHEPEDDAKVNGFGKGNPWLGANGVYNGVTGISATGTHSSISTGTTIPISGSGLPSSGALCDASTGAAFTYTLSGSTLTVGTVLTAGAVNSGDTLEQAWTQDLTAQAGDAGQAQAAANLYAQFSAALWNLADAVALVSVPVFNMESGSWENGHFGGGNMWATAFQSALGMPFVVTTDAYVQPGGDNIHIGTIPTPQSLMQTSLAWAIANGKKWGVGEHGVAPQEKNGVAHGSISDPLSKAYYFQSELHPYLAANEDTIEFICFQGNVLVDVGGVYQGRHPYGDFDDNGQADCTTALAGIVNDAGLWTSDHSVEPYGVVGMVEGATAQVGATEGATGILGQIAGATGEVDV